MSMTAWRAICILITSEQQALAGIVISKSAPAFEPNLQTRLDRRSTLNDAVPLQTGSAGNAATARVSNR